MEGVHFPHEVTLNVNVHHHGDDGHSKEILGLLHSIQNQLRNIMATEQELLDVITKIDVATTKQGVALASEATLLQTISDEMDALILAAKNTGVSATTLAALQSQADKIQAVSDSLDAQAAFSTAIAAKVASPVPVPVPPPTP